MRKWFTKKKEEKAEKKRLELEEERRQQEMLREQRTPFAVHPPSRQAEQIHYFPDTTLLKDCLMEKQIMNLLVQKYPDKYKEKPGAQQKNPKITKKS